MRSPLELEPFPLHASAQHGATSKHALNTAPRAYVRSARRPSPFAHRCDALSLERAAAQEQAEATAEQLDELKQRLTVLQLNAQAARSEAAQQASVLGKQQQQLEALAAQARLPEIVDEPLMTASRRSLTNL